MNNEIKQGSYVHYSPMFGSTENGRVKSIGEDYAFVVYNCNDEWHRYEDYTGQKTDLPDLKPGWVDSLNNQIETPNK